MNKTNYVFINPVMQIWVLPTADIETYIQPSSATPSETRGRRAMPGVFAITIADAASDGILIEVVIRQLIVVVSLPRTLADTVASHHDGEHRT